jgi:ankyrin repeat protein
MSHGAAQHAKSKNDYARLSTACTKNDSATVEQLLDKGIDPSIKLREGRTPLHIAAGQKAPKVVELLIARGAKIDANDNEGNTPLGAAAVRGVLETAGLLCAAGADINARLSHGETSLYKACQNNRINMVKFLLDSGADTTLRTDSGETVLHAAARAGAYKIVRYLVDTVGFDVHARTKSFRDDLTNGEDNGCNVLTYAACAERGQITETIAYLLDKGVDPYGDGFYLASAVERSLNHLGLFKQLIARNVDQEACSLALISAMGRGLDNVVRYLVDDLKIDPNIRDSKGKVLALLERVAGTEDEATGLLAYDDLPRFMAERDGEPESLLMFHAGYDNRIDADIVPLLLANGACFDTPRASGETPLHEVSSLGHTAKTMALLTAQMHNLQQLSENDNVRWQRVDDATSSRRSAKRVCRPVDSSGMYVAAKRHQG